MGASCASCFEGLVHGSTPPAPRGSCGRPSPPRLRLLREEPPIIPPAGRLLREEPVSTKPIPPVGRKKAVLIGINYVGQQAELSGCHNDVKNVQDLLGCDTEFLLLTGIVVGRRWLVRRLRRGAQHPQAPRTTSPPPPLPPPLPSHIGGGPTSQVVGVVCRWCQSQVVGVVWCWWWSHIAGCWGSTAVVPHRRLLG